MQGPIVAVMRASLARMRASAPPHPHPRWVCTEVRMERNFRCKPGGFWSRAYLCAFTEIGWGPPVPSPFG